MDAFYAYTYSSAGWLALQAVPLLLSPSLIIILLSNEAREATTLETYFSQSLALSLLALAVLSILLTGSIPLTSSIADPISDSSGIEDPKAPYAVPIIIVSTIFHVTCTIYSYTYYTSPLTSNSGFLLGVIGYGCLAAMGGWCLLFRSERGRMKRGVDKRVSGWPFRNAESDQRREKKRL